MESERDDLPSPDDATLITRIAVLPDSAHRWTGNGAREQADHHGLVNPASGPMYLRLEWTSPGRSETVRVGDYRVNPRGLANRGLVQEKGKQVRLRFVRWLDGMVVIQANDSSPWLAVGYAVFDSE